MGLTEDQPAVVEEIVKFFFVGWGVDGFFGNVADTDPQGSAYFYRSRIQSPRKK